MNRYSTDSRTGLRFLAAGVIVLLIVLCSVRGATQTPSPLAPKPQHEEAARQIARILPREHLLRLPMSEEVAYRAWTNFFNMLDYEHVFFLRSDVNRFRAAAPLLADKLIEGDVTFAFQVMEVYKERVRDRVEYAAKRLKQPFDLDRAESFAWKRKDAPWPETEGARDELWRQRLQNELVTRLVAAELSSGTNAPGTNALATNASATNIAVHADAIIKRYQHMRTIISDNDSDWVVQVYLSAFTRAYDPHTDYMSPSSAEDFNIDMKLSLIGIGAELTTEDGAAKIRRLIPGGPAARDTRDIRLMENDKIIAVGQGSKGEMVDTLHWPLNKVVRLIRGEKGTTVLLTVIPASDPTGLSTKRVDLVRDEVKLEDQAVKSMVENAPDSKGQNRRIGVIKVPAFYADMKAGASGRGDFRSVCRDIATAIEKLRGERVEGIVLDLRGNGGGALIEAVRVTGLFIPTGPVVQVKEGFRVRILPDTDPSVAYDGPLVVLVNRLSASASEIVAGALQDYGRALVVGDSKTHGKGSVQTLIELDREGRLGQIKITNASYFRITGSSTQLRGVTPDIVIPSQLDFYPELGEDKQPNAIPWSTVSPALFTPATGLAKILPDLIAASERRRAADSRFVAYNKLLQRIDSVNRLNELPLGIAERRRLAESEKELTELQKELDPDGEEDQHKPDTKQKSKTADLVLDESLHILAETILLQPSVMPPANRPLVMPQWMQEWFKETP
jgi:carboxyl-terminal processing protease